MKTNTSIDGRTPGPWLVNPLSAWVEIPGEDAPICAMLWPTELRSEDETFANARLISAAPDMLKALVDLVNSFEKHRPKELWDAARAAIAKAGGQP